MQKYFNSKNIYKSLITFYCILITIVVIVMSIILSRRDDDKCVCRLPERPPREIIINDMSSNNENSE